MRPPPDGLHAGHFLRWARLRAVGCGYWGACCAGNQLEVALPAAGESVRDWLASHRLRNTTFFGGKGPRAVRFLNLWLARPVQVRLLADKPAATARGNASFSIVPTCDMTHPFLRGLFSFCHTSDRALWPLEEKRSFSSHLPIPRRSFHRALFVDALNAGRARAAISERRRRGVMRRARLRFESMRLRCALPWSPGAKALAGQHSRRCFNLVMTTA